MTTKQYQELIDKMDLLIKEQQATIDFIKNWKAKDEYLKHYNLDPETMEAYDNMREQEVNAELLKN